MLYVLHGCAYAVPTAVKATLFILFVWQSFYVDSFILLKDCLGYKFASITRLVGLLLGRIAEYLVLYKIVGNWLPPMKINL